MILPVASISNKSDLAANDTVIKTLQKVVVVTETYTVLFQTREAVKKQAHKPRLPTSA